MHFITLGSHKIEVSVSMGARMVKHKDIQKLLELEDDEVTDYFVSSDALTKPLFDKVYIDGTATAEQKIILDGIMLVGINPLIDEACRIDLRGVSYIDEFTSSLKMNSEIIAVDR